MFPGIYEFGIDILVDILLKIYSSVLYAIDPAAIYQIGPIKLFFRLFYRIQEILPESFQRQCESYGSSHDRGVVGE